MFKKIAPDTTAIGVADTDLDMFENQYPLINGVTYNSYVISEGGTTAVIDTSDRRRGCYWLENLESTATKVDFLIVQHMEPDHSAMIGEFMKRHPDAVVVSSAQALKMIEQFFPELDLRGRTRAIKEGDELEVGSHRLKFIAAPMVHWPEVMMTYDTTTGTLFSADAFGTFGTDDSVEALWPDEARRYYTNIVGKYGPQVQRVLAKVTALENMRLIASLHGPLIEGEKIEECINLYNLWSRYEPELPDGILIAYASIYGNTERVALEIAERLRARNVTVAVCDLCRTDVSRAVAQAFRMGTIVAAAPTYDASLFPAMHHFLYHIRLKGLCGRRFALVENGSWAPTAATAMTKMIEELKGCTVMPEKITIKSAPDSKTFEEIDRFVARL